MQVLSLNQNFNRYNNYNQQFKGYTAKQICAELCKGACCDHGTPVNATLKKITDKICTEYKNIPDNLKSTVLIKTSVVKWIVNSQKPDVRSVNNLANTYIDAIAKEADPEKIKELEAKLSQLNDKLAELLNDDESFCAVTNPELANKSDFEIITSDRNVCMYKDDGKTNLCTIYNGIQDKEGKTVNRPYACLQVGSEEMPCPWHHPEKYSELYYKTQHMLESKGYSKLPQHAIQQYIAQQYNLNEVFAEKIWKPYIESLNIQA